MLYRLPPHPRLANYRQWQSLTYGSKSNGLQFHSSARVHQNDNPPNHYETLDLSPDASPSDIKKQFYTLSKRHHPDLHPHDPDASPRFVAITTAYTTLSDPTSRRRYDASLFPASSSSSAAGRTGSFSSASANSSPAGGRPASGLSKRRGTFRGPPPSFYRSGGWGAASAKRRANAGFRHEEGGSDSGSAGSSASSSAAGGDAAGGGYTGSTEGGTYTGASGAFGAGSFSGFAGGGGGSGGAVDDEVPHFDRAGHFRTQQKVEGHRNRRGPVDAWGNEIGGVGGGSGSLLMSFVVLTGVVAGCVMIPNLFMRAGPGTRGNGEEGKRRAG
ncbi:DnaJ-domain-containing protein, partial [Viridothelium virens]